MITSDSDKCHHILQNIIANAVKFTDSGSVDISARFVGSEVMVSVKDTGIGIPPDEIPFIYDEFRQVDGTSSRLYGGTGLGLAIADKYARKLNARIEVISEPGKGSTFTLTFPIESSSGKPLQTPQGLSTIYHEEGSLPELKMSAAIEKTILVVEDSEPAIVQLSWILKEQGYQVAVARDGFEALNAVKMKIPDAIILDLMMPGMDGFEVLDRIRGTQITASIPVLILTAMYLGPADLERLSQNHIHQLVQKGNINKNELLLVVREMLFPHEKSEPESRKKEGFRTKAKSPATILIIDDNVDNGTTLKALCQNKNSIISLTDGVDGVARAKSLNPNLILLDVSLPGLDGFKVFDEIRREDFLRHIPIIAVTAKAMKGDREQILAHGFDDYISKPIEQEIFEETIRKWIL
jgi:CheY-like chemotaxis protein